MIVLKLADNISNTLPMIEGTFVGLVRVQRKALMLWIIVVGFIGCDGSKGHEPLMQEYVQSLQELNTFFSHEEVGRVQTLSVILDKVMPKGRFVRKRARRYQVPPAPSINVRDFMKITGCRIARHIAFRNSPLGRVMLPSQKLAYEHRFLRDAEDCHLDGEVMNHLQTVIDHKHTFWSQYQWNAIWSGMAMARFFSQSWPRNHKIRRLDAGDEARFLWLGNLRPSLQVNLSSSLEQNLAQIPTYVGGQIILNASQSLSLLKVSRQGLKLFLKQVGMNNLSSNEALCLKVKTTLNLFGQLQGKVSRAYQDLDRLQRAIKPLLLNLSSYPSKEMEVFIDRWFISTKDGSVLRQLKALSKDNVNLWMTLQSGLVCV
jgi:hypothetical protein